MKNLEAAQVKMEEKLNSMTNFIDQELEKTKDSPVGIQHNSIHFRYRVFHTKKTFCILCRHHNCLVWIGLASVAK